MKFEKIPIPVEIQISNINFGVVTQVKKVAFNQKSSMNLSIRLKTHILYVNTLLDKYSKIKSPQERAQAFGLGSGVFI